MSHDCLRSLDHWVVVVCYLTSNLISSVMKDRGTKCCCRIDVFKGLHGIVDTNLSTMVIGSLGLELHEDPGGKVLLVLPHLLLREDAVKESLKLTGLL